VYTLPVIFAVFAAVPPAASAPTDPIPLQISPKGDALDLNEGGKTIAQLTPRTPPKERGFPTARRVEVAEHRILEVRIPTQGKEPVRTEVWLAEMVSGKPRILFSDWVGPLDVDGETSNELVVSPLGIELFQRARRLSRCDGEPVRLFHKTFDFKSREFKATPFIPSANATITLESRRGDATMPTEAPLGGFFFSAASSSPGAQGNVGQLKAPAGINDDDPKSIWQVDRGQTGLGEILTARSSGGFPITGIRFLPGDTSSEKAYRNTARPRSIRLIFTGTPAVDVKLVDDADGGIKRFEQPFWIRLPTPVASTCVSVLILEKTGGKEPLAIANMEILTELDGPNAVNHLLSDMAEARSCESRKALFLRLGAAQALALGETIAKTPPGQGRECLVETLGDLFPPSTDPLPDLGDALASILTRATVREERIALRLANRIPRVPLEVLTALLANEKSPQEDRLLAGRFLLASGTPSALEAVLAVVGTGSGSFRAGLRSLFGSSHPAIAPMVLTAIKATPTANVSRYADLLMLLGSQARNEPKLHSEALFVLRMAVAPEMPFEIQVRAITSIGLFATATAVGLLAELQALVRDPTLRQFITTELARSSLPVALPALRTALADGDPKVREIAALGLGQRRDMSAVPLIIQGAEQEPWPFVRRAEIVALGDLCTPQGNELLMRAFQRDEVEVRQAAMQGLYQCKDHRALTVLIRTLGREPENPELRATAARLLGGLRDRRTVSHIEEALSRLIVESQADLALEGVVSHTVMALAAIGGQRAAKAIATLLSDERVSIQRMGVDALGQLCDPEVGQPALEKAAKSKDESISIPAAAAQARCRVSKPATSEPQP
jgi:HEAT repeat protein